MSNIRKWIFKRFRRAITKIIAAILGIVSLIALASGPVVARDATTILGIAVWAGFVLLGVSAITGFMVVKWMNRSVKYYDDSGPSVRFAASETDTIGEIPVNHMRIISPTYTRGIGGPVSRVRDGNA